MTPQNNLLYEAVRHASLDLFYFSIIIGGDVHFIDTCGTTLLHTACEKGHTTFVSVLIQHGLSINAINYHGDTPLHLAIKKRKINSIRALLTYPSIQIDIENQKFESPLLLAIQLHYHSIVSLLLQHSPQLAKQQCYDEEKTYLHFAAESKNYQACIALLALGADTNAKDIYDITPLHYAIENGDLELVDIFVQHGGDLTIRDYNGCSGLHWAIESGNINTLEYVLERTHDIEDLAYGYESPLIVALYCYEDGKCNLDVIEILLEKKANPNYQDDHGNTSLHIAAGLNDSSLIDLLLEYKADKYIRNHLGQAPFDIALSYDCRRRILHKLT